jgi:ATP-binding cassette, subfamily B, bacterial MsbA
VLLLDHQERTGWNEFPKQKDTLQPRRVFNLIDGLHGLSANDARNDQPGQNLTKMNKLGDVLRFGWPYLRRYWTRLLAGVLLGVLFGLSNASFVWATRTLIGRMNPESPVIQLATPSADQVQAVQPPQPVSPVQGLLARWDEVTQRWIDPWLPRIHRPLDVRQFLGGLLFLPVLVAFRGYTGFLSSYCLAWASERVVNDLRVDVLDKLSSLSFDFFNRSTMGDLVTRVNGDTAMLQRCLNLGIGDLIKEPMTVVGLVVALCLIDWQLALLAVAAFPVCVVPMIILGRKARRAAKAGLDTTITQSSLLFETLSGIRVVKAFGLEAEQLTRFRTLSRQLVHHGMKGIRAKELINPFIETIAMVGLGLLVIYIVVQQRSVEDMVGFLTGMIFLYTPVKKLARLHVLFEQTSVGVQRLIQILHEMPTVQEPAVPKRLHTFRESLVFDHVSFTYGSVPVLHEIHLTVPIGTRLGIAGESGSGKSTLVNLLFRFYDPTQGSIRFDGLDLREVSLSDLRHHMALVSQEVVLFDMSVSQNIACGKPGATAEEVESAARMAFAHDFILQLPDGYQTRIGERGVTLSGGQRQRLAIARAFIRNAPILVLDEATAALDSQAEAEVQAAIERLEQNRTVVCVAHRLSTLANMDRILVLSQGRVVEEGDFNSLLRRQGPFAKMAQRQGLVLSPMPTA